jgi:FMN phosphatase YigB (HAD superfamily)
MKFSLETRPRADLRREIPAAAEGGGSVLQPDAFHLRALWRSLGPYRHAPKAGTTPSQAACFDVFDTLITRCWWRPEDLFLDAGARLREGGLTGESPEAWAARRVAAEAALRAAPGVEEVTLEAIHIRLAEESGLSPEQARTARVAEEEAELAAIRPIAPMLCQLARARQQGLKVALISDTYFDHGFLMRLLGRCGVDVLPDCVFASSTTGETKRSGRLFIRVAGKLGVPTAAMTHIGDHPHSDLASARTSGLQARLATLGQPTRYEMLLHAAGEGYGPAMRSALAGSARAARLSIDPVSAEQRAIWTIGTNVAGPLLAGFVLWTLIQARQRGLGRLHYVARDGQILMRIAEQLCTRLGWEVECRYLLGSRQAWHLPALQQLDANAMQWLAPEGASDPLRNALARAELAPEAMQDALARHGLADPALLDQPLPQPALAALLQDPEVTDLLLRGAAVRRRFALSYLAQQGLLDGGPVAIVDIGWHGRLQRSLQQLLEQGAPPDRPAPELHGFYFGLKSQPPELPAGAIHSFVGEDSALNRLNPVLLEIFCAADHGTVRRYVPGRHGRIDAELAASSDERALDWGLATLQRAITAVTEELDHALARAPRQPLETWVELLRDAGLAAFDLFRRDPTTEEAEVFGRFPHADGQLHDSWEDCAPPARGLQLLRLGLGLRDPEYAGHWPEASVRRGGGALGAGLVALRRLKHRAEAAPGAGS